MKKTIIYSIAALFFFLAVNTVMAAPMPWGIALNEETQECAGFWGGDEFVYYSLPDGWQEYYPDYSSEDEDEWFIIRTEADECDFEAEDEQACCEELGYTYVSENIGDLSGYDYDLINATRGYNDDDSTSWTWLFIALGIGLVILIVIIIVIVLVVKKSKRE